MPLSNTCCLKTSKWAFLFGTIICIGSSACSLLIFIVSKCCKKYYENGSEYVINNETDAVINDIINYVKSPSSDFKGKMIVFNKANLKEKIERFVRKCKKCNKLVFNKENEKNFCCEQCRSNKLCVIA